MTVGSFPRPRHHRAPVASELRTVVLVAEHDAPVRRFLRLALELDGHEVIETTCGDEAISALASCPVDAVVTDDVLPRATGIDVVLVARRMGLQVPCLILAGRSDTAVAVRSMELGNVALVPKPAGVEQVLGCVARAIRRRRRISASGRSRRTTRCRCSPGSTNSRS
jgi:two-component system KDP operon response regulator KdpE